MELISNVPASSIEYATNSPFTFQIKGSVFSIDPLTPTDYLTINKRIRTSLVALQYYDILDKKEISKQFLKNGALDRKNATAIIDILVDLMEPKTPKETIGILVQQFKKYWFKPSRWALSLKSWFFKNISMDQLLDLASYFMRYSSETKKKIHQSLQEGIESVTQEKKTTTQLSSGEALMLDSLSPGGIAGIAEEHGSLSA